MGPQSGGVSPRGPLSTDLILVQWGAPRQEEDAGKGCEERNMEVWGKDAFVGLNPGSSACDLGTSLSLLVLQFPHL